LEKLILLVQVVIKHKKRDVFIALSIALGSLKHLAKQLKLFQAVSRLLKQVTLLLMHLRLPDLVLSLVT
jgi:hypothetical protein